MSDPGVIYAAQKWPTNAHMIVDCVRLGYLRSDWLTLDPTYGLGTFWRLWQPKTLVKADLYTHDITKGIDQLDFTRMPEIPDNWFDAVVYDPPYKLNGTPSPEERRYGVQVPTRWQDRMTLIRDGVTECARVTKRRGFLLVKCMDQVVSGKVVWQTDEITRWAKLAGMTKVDRLDFLTDPRPQPHARQIHARRNYSTLLIFQK